MKKLLLATKDRESNNQYVKELYSVFAGYLEIYSYSWEIEQGRPLERDIPVPDVLLLGSPYSFPESRPFINKDTKIIMLSFTFGKEVINKLRSLPVGTETLTCYKHYSEAHQAAYALYESGLQNLNLYINYLNNKNIVGKKMDVALYSEFCGSVPDDISNVIDLGPMYLSLNTLLDISMAAGILDEEMESRILDYCSKISLPMNHTSYFFNNSSMASMSLKAVTDCIDYGMIIIDENGKIINHNQQFKKLFLIDREIFGNNLANISQLNFISEEILQADNVKDKMVESCTKNQQLLMSKEKINKDNEDFDIFLVLFKDITKINSLETAFKKQARRNGHVAKHTFSEIIHTCDKMNTLIERCRKIAGVDKPTLIVGESGTGKELFASSIHNASKRSGFPFVALNCATIPENLLESELFGYEEGAFTGAKKGGKTGLFQSANKGTLFLDEIGELSLEMQAKLLRVLEEKEIMRVGGDEIISIDTRIIAATNRNLKSLLDSGKFRLDLYYRLNTLTVSIPPLRDRIEDISVLVEYFSASYNNYADKKSFTREVQEFFRSYDWPGNIREVRNCIEYMVSIGDNPLGIEDLPDYLLEEYSKEYGSLRAVEVDNGIKISIQDKKELLAVLEVLEIKSLGRRKLAEALRDKSCDISEYKLRKILKNLSDSGIIILGEGSAGCNITDKGISLLKDLSQQML